MPAPIETHPYRAVFLHGFLGRGADWLEIVEGLGDVQCICPDLPGHGDAPIPEGSFEAAVERVVRSLVALSELPAPLVGYSMGGRIALYIALTFPQHVTRLVVESASPGLRTGEERAARHRADEAMAARLEGISETEPSGFRAFLEEWYAQPLFHTLSPGQRARLIAARQSARPAWLAAGLRMLGTGVQPDLWERLHELRMPVLLIAGERDEKFCRIAREMRSRNPAIQLEIVPGCGHNVHLEDPGRYTTVLRRFLAL